MNKMKTPIISELTTGVFYNSMSNKDFYRIKFNSPLSALTESSGILSLIK
jgi:hypothetical protein